MAKAKKMTDTALTNAMAEWEKSYGAGTLELDDKFIPYIVCPSGSLTLDYHLGVGGIVLGRLHEWWGKDGIGKSTLAMCAVAEAQRMFPSRLTGWIDVEQKADKPWMDAHGVNRKRCAIFTPESAEDVADALKDMVRKFEPSIIVLDSIGAMIPEAEKEKDADKAVMAQQAKIVTRMVKIAAVEARLHNTAIIFINQVRANVSGYGKATTTGGGFALRHVTTTKVEFKSTDTVYFVGSGDNKVQVGHMLAAKIERNAVAPAYRTARISMFNQDTEKYGPMGVDRASEAVDLGIATGVIMQEAGGYYTVPGTGERIRGRDKVLVAVREDRSLIDSLRELIIATKAGEVHEEDPTEIEPGEMAFRGVDSLGED